MKDEDRLASTAWKGIVALASQHSLEETVNKLEATVKARGLTALARIDFGGDGGRAGLRMNPALLLTFGNPKAGTPPMAAIDFPLKVPVSQDAGGKVWASCSSLECLMSRHGILEGLLGDVAGMGAVLRSAVA